MIPVITSQTIADLKADIPTPLQYGTMWEYYLAFMVWSLDTGKWSKDANLAVFSAMSYQQSVNNSDSKIALGLFMSAALKQGKKPSDFGVNSAFTSWDMTALSDRYVKNRFKFNDEGEGLMLKPMPGYPDSFLLPRCQLAPSGRLCWFNFPSTMYGQTSAVPGGKGSFSLDWYECDPYNNFANNLFGKNQGYDKIAGVASSGQFEPSTAALAKLQCAYNDRSKNTNYFFFGVPLIPIDRILFDEWVKKGSKDGNPGAAYATPHLWKSPWTSALVCSVNGTPYYSQLSAEKMMWVQVQYYIDNFLKEPYCFKDLIPYGKSYPNEILEYVKIHPDKSKAQNFLGQCDFLIQPVGEKNFWDKLYAVAPVVIAGVATVVTMGAGTPALVATVGGLVTGTIVKLNAAQQKNADAIIAYGKQHSAQLQDASNLNPEGIKETIEGSNEGNNEGLIVKNLWWIILLIVAVVLFFILKKRK